MNPKTKKKPTSAMRRINRYYRYSLAILGHSPDAHLYDLAGASFYDSIFQPPERSRAREFLNRLHELDEGLDYLESKIFHYDCLEMGRHYHYWYLTYANKNSYRRKKRHLEAKLSEAFQ